MAPVQIAFVRMGPMDRTEVRRAVNESRAALRRHVEAINVMAVRDAVECRDKPGTAEVRAWRQNVLANLARPRRSRNRK